MNTKEILKAVQATLDGTLPFPQIVANLITQGVEYYFVDYAMRTFTLYSASAVSVQAPLSYENLPAIASDLDLVALKANILDSQQNGQKFYDFSQRAMSAGVQGYFAFLRGQRVVYLGRQGDQHTEWFPGAKP